MPTPSVGLDPDPAAVLLDDVAGDRQPETGPAGLAADPRPVDLVEALEDPGLGGPRDADPVVGDGDDDLVGRPHRTLTADVAAVGAELHRVVEEVDEDLAEPVLVAADRRQRLVDRRSRGRRPGGRRRAAAARSTRSRPRRGRAARATPSAPPLSIRDRSSSSLTIWTRWPVSTSILSIRSRIRGGIASPAASASRVERLGQQADRRERRPQLVRQVVDELGPDLLEPAQLGDVLEDEPDVPAGRAGARGPRAAGRRRRRRPPRRSPTRSSSAATGDRLDLGVEERLDQRPADERAGRTAEERVGGRVRAGRCAGRRRPIRTP